MIEATSSIFASHILYTCTASPRVNAAISLRSFYEPIANLERNAQIRHFINSSDFPEFEFTRLNQVHGAAVVEAQPGLVADADGLITDVEGVFLAIVVADCLPIFIWDIDATCAALLHAGWQGTCQGIASQGIEALVNRYACDPANLQVLLGPCICQDCYEVGPEVAEEFSADVLLPGKGDRSNLDLRKANHIRMIEAGVSADAIYSDNRCTFCHEDLFFSYRREGIATGRMIAILGIAPPGN